MGLSKYQTKSELVSVNSSDFVVFCSLTPPPMLHLHSHSNPVVLTPSAKVLQFSSIRVVMKYCISCIIIPDYYGSLAADKTRGSGSGASTHTTCGLFPVHPTRSMLPGVSLGQGVVESVGCCRFDNKKKPSNTVRY